MPRSSRRRLARPCLSFQRLETRLALAAIDPIFVPVGDVTNAADPANGYGRVTESFRIGKYEVTIGEYTAFLNAVAAEDPAGLYHEGMAQDRTSAGITRTSTAAGFTYAVTGPAGITPPGATSPAERPITYVTWFDAARFANWMSNGQPSGRQTTRTTENGAYNLARASGGRAVARNAINPNTRSAPTFFLPTENEWYKAAYFTPDKGGAPGYFLYATQQDVAPTNNAAATGVPVVNYLQGVIYSVTQSAVFSTTQNYLTDVGAFATTTSHYGTLDQNGNVYEWNDLTGAAGRLRGQRGGFWAGGAITLQKFTFTQVTAGREANDAGFRLVSSAVARPA